MIPNSVFAQIALRLSAHPENVATEGLAYIVERHARAWPSLRRLIARAGVDLPENIVVATQASGSDGSIPDLAFTDSSGDQVLLLEAKFWAGLTANQPGAYLNRLNTEKSGLVLVVAPTLRYDTVWPKIKQAAGLAGFPVLSESEPLSGFRLAPVTATIQLGLVTWPSLLAALYDAATTSEDAPFASDVAQLRALTEYMDTHGFTPLGHGDVAPTIGRRVKQYADLIDSVVQTLVASHGADTKNLSTGGSQATYGRFFFLGGLACFFAYSPNLWSHAGETPFWLSIAEANWKDTPRILECLKQAAAGTDLSVVSAGGRATISVHPPLGVERDQVVSEMAARIVGLIDAVGQSSGPVAEQ